VAFSATVDDGCDVSKLSIEIPNATQLEVQEIDYKNGQLHCPVVGKVDDYETIDIDDSKE